MELGQEMTAGGSDGDGDLLAGLPDEIVLMEIITRLPWFTRPVCRAVSKAWRAWIDASTKRPGALIKSREHHLPLLQECILISAFQFRTFVAKCCQGPPEDNDFYRVVEWQGLAYYVDRRWRELASLQSVFPEWSEPPLLEASAGIVYAFTNGTFNGSFVAKMDVAGGDWAWEIFSLPYYIYRNDLPIPCNGKMYLAGGERGGSSTSSSDDHKGEQGLPVEILYRDQLRALHRKKSSGMVEEEELYCLIAHKSPRLSTLETLAYNDCAKSWRTREMVTIPYFPPWTHFQEIQLANGDCFEPAPDQGINIVWIDDAASILRWFNSSVHQTWVEFEYNTRWENKSLLYPRFIHGWLYGMFCNKDCDEQDEILYSLYGLFCNEDYDEQEEIISSLQERTATIMKGKMVVEHNQVVWEHRLDVECFQPMNSPIEEAAAAVHAYTVMA